jgi:hypothetical protein
MLMLMLMLLLMLGLIVLKISFFAQISMSRSNNQLPLIAKKFTTITIFKQLFWHCGEIVNKK